MIGHENDSAAGIIVNVGYKKGEKVMKKIMVLFSVILLLVACSKEVEPAKEGTPKTVEDQTKPEDAAEQKEKNQTYEDLVGEKENGENPNASKVTTEEKVQVEAIKELFQSEQDEDIQSRLMAEKTVTNAVVKIMNELDIIVITVEVNESLKKDDADQLAEKYVKLAKQQYENFSTHVIIHQSGKELTKNSIE